MARVETLNEARSKIARTAAQLNARYGKGSTLPALILMMDDARPADWLEAVRALPSGSAVIIRHRDGHKREAVARSVRPVCAARRIRMLIADDAALAVRARADGVHLPEKRATRIAGLKGLYPRWLITASAHTARSVTRASRGGADAVLIAPAFPTASHPGRPALGPLRLAALAAQARVPVYALGGIDAVSVRRLRSMALNGVALIGGWTG